MVLSELSLEEYAILERGNGGTVVESGGVYWRAVRPFFYQPLALFGQYPGRLTEGPPLSWLGGWQHAVPTGERGNSSLRLIFFDHASQYSLEKSVGTRRRERLKSALRDLAVRAIHDPAQLVKEAYPVYRDFHQRTGFQCMRDRSSIEGFQGWADRLYKSGKLYVYGAYAAGNLEAVSVCYRLQSTLVFAASFCSTRSLALWSSDLMVHHARETAAADPCIQRVFATRYRGGGGLDQFYLNRGASVITLPAWLQINPVADHLLAFANPVAHRGLWGIEEGYRDDSPQSERRLAP